MKNSIRKSLLGFFATTLLILVTIPASAATLSLQPTVQNAVPTDTVSLELVISGLNVGGADSLGDFDIDIGFDTTALSFLGYSLGSSLGDIASFEAVDFSFGLGGGLVNISEVSLLTVAELDALQSDSFTLATFDFSVDVLAVGSSTSVVIDTVYTLGDANGRPLTLDSTTDATIRNPSVGVPEASTLMLLMVGLIGIGATRRRRSK